MCPPPRLSNPLQRHLQQPRRHLPSLASLPLPWLLLRPTQRAKALNQSDFAALLVLRITRSQRTPIASFRQCFQVKRKCALPQHPERPALTNKFGPFDGGCTGHQGVVILRPLAGRFLRLRLENRKPATTPKIQGPMTGLLPRIVRWQHSFLIIRQTGKGNCPSCRWSTEFFRRGLFLHL
jgi:hypothetical protein